MRHADIEGESPGDEGQLLKYYRKSKYPPGSKVPSVWDMEYDEDPVTRLGKPGGATATATAIITALVNSLPGTPAKRMGPATSWADHRYMRRRPSDLYTTSVEAEGDLISNRDWPVRDTTSAATIAKRIIGRR